MRGTLRGRGEGKLEVGGKGEGEEGKLGGRRVRGRMVMVDREGEDGRARGRTDCWNAGWDAGRDGGLLDLVCSVRWRREQDPVLALRLEIDWPMAGALVPMA